MQSQAESHAPVLPCIMFSNVTHESMPSFCANKKGLSPFICTLHQLNRESSFWIFKWKLNLFWQGQKHYFPQWATQLRLSYKITVWNNATRLNWMTSRGMSRANSFFNCYIQLGIQISLFSWSVSKTMAALFVSICLRSSSEERKKRARGSVHVSLEAEHPQAPVVPTANPQHACMCSLFISVKHQLVF